jgi:hypothetical protein
MRQVNQIRKIKSGYFLQFVAYLSRFYGKVQGPRINCKILKIKKVVDFD